MEQKQTIGFLYYFTHEYYTRKYFSSRNNFIEDENEYWWALKKNYPNYCGWCIYDKYDLATGMRIA